MTVRLGTSPDLPERVVVTAQLLVEAVRVTTESPLAGRPIRDGAPGTTGPGRRPW